MATPWAAATGRLNFVAYHPLPSSSRKNIPKFTGDGKVTVDEHIRAFFTAINILGVSHEDVVVRLFVETLTEAAADWFYYLADGSITNWNTMRVAFEDRFKSVENEYALLVQLTSVKKLPSTGMRDFVANFNKIVHKIPVANRPTAGNLKTFSISAMPPDIGFELRRSRPADLKVAQRTAVELEDDMIAAGRWNHEIHNRASISEATSQEEMIQKLSNELIVLKRQLPNFNNLYQRSFSEQASKCNNKPLQLPGPQERLVSEVPHERVSGNFENLFLEYELDPEKQNAKVVVDSKFPPARQGQPTSKTQSTDVNSEKYVLSSPILPALKESEFISSSVSPQWMGHQLEESDQQEEHFQPVENNMPEPSQEEEKVVFIPCYSTVFSLESLITPLDSSFEVEKKTLFSKEEHNEKILENALPMSEIKCQEHTTNSSEVIKEDV